MPLDYHQLVISAAAAVKVLRVRVGPLPPLCLFGNVYIVHKDDKQKQLRKKDSFTIKSSIHEE